MKNKIGKNKKKIIQLRLQWTTNIKENKKKNPLDLKLNEAFSSI